MNYVWAKTLIELLILPPASPIIILGIGVLLLMVGRRLGKLFVLVGFVFTYLSSIPAVVYPLAAAWEAHDRPLRTIPRKAQAIVVLGGGSRPAPAYGDQDSVTLLTLQRIRYAAYLARRSGLPILVSGGRDWFGERYSEAQLMASLLKQDYGIHVRWLDSASRTTWGNAKESARILKPQGLVRVLLVTQAWHMPRAVWAFRNAGFSPVPAPVGFISRGWEQRGALAWVPQEWAISTMAELAHEVVGLAWYRLRAWRTADS